MFDGTTSAMRKIVAMMLESAHEGLARYVREKMCANIDRVRSIVREDDRIVFEVTVQKSCNRAVAIVESFGGLPREEMGSTVDICVILADEAIERIAYSSRRMRRV